MTISEPMTLATDWALALLAAGLGVRLWRSGRDRAQVSPRWLAAAFLGLACSAWLGGISHGFAVPLGETGVARTWRATTFAVGATSFCLLAAAAVASLQGLARRLVLVAAALQLGVYWAWMTRHDEFVWVILDYGITMLVTAMLVVRYALRAGSRRSAPAGWILAAIGVSLVAAAVQASGLSLHRHFNHNDLYHVIQMVGVLFFYRGGRALEDAAAHRPSPGGDRSLHRPFR